MTWPLPFGVHPVTHLPELVVHGGHPEAEHFHQLALALVALVGPGEPGRKRPNTSSFLGFEKVKNPEKSGTVWKNLEKSGKLSLKFGDFVCFFPIVAGFVYD